jgi:hypothetical protein
MSALGSQAFCQNLTTKTITDINNQTGLPGQVLASTPNGIDWVVAGGGGADLQTVCTIGNTTNTNIIQTLGGALIQDPRILISTNTLSCPIKIGFAPCLGITGTVAIGTNTGVLGQGDFSIAIGESAGENQALDCVAIGSLAGQSQLSGAVAVGNLAGQANQGLNSVAIGVNSGSLNQGAGAIAIGYEAAPDSQQDGSVAIGAQAGYKSLALNAIAIGGSALQNANGVGKESIAIGYLAMDQPPQFDNNIILNSTGVSFPDFATFPPTSGGRFYVAFIRADDGSHTNNQTLQYDTDTGEIYHL